MRKFLLQLIALFLIPCLVADSLRAISLYSQRNEECVSLQPTTCALAATAEAFPKARIGIKPVQAPYNPLDPRNMRAALGSPYAKTLFAVLGGDALSKTIAHYTLPLYTAAVQSVTHPQISEACKLIYQAILQGDLHFTRVHHLVPDADRFEALSRVVSILAGLIFIPSLRNAMSAAQTLQQRLLINVLRFFYISVGVLGGGILGNILEQMLHGYVTDFLRFGHGPRTAFVNIADFAILSATTTFVVFGVLTAVIVAVVFIRRLRALLLKGLGMGMILILLSAQTSSMVAQVLAQPPGRSTVVKPVTPKYSEAQIRAALLKVVADHQDFRDCIDAMPLLPGYSKVDLHNAVNAFKTLVATAQFKYVKGSWFTIDRAQGIFEIDPDLFDWLIQHGGFVIFHEIAHLTQHQMNQKDTGAQDLAQLRKQVGQIKTLAEMEALKKRMEAIQIKVLRSRWTKEIEATYFETALWIVEAQLKKKDVHAYVRGKITAIMGMPYEQYVKLNFSAQRPFTSLDNLILQHLIRIGIFEPSKISDAFVDECVDHLGNRSIVALMLPLMQSDLDPTLTAESFIERMKHDAPFLKRFEKWAREVLLGRTSPHAQRNQKFPSLEVAA